MKLLNPTKISSQILIIGPAWVGDMVMAQTLFKFLHSHNSEVQIDVLAPAWTIPIVERMPEVRSSYHHPLGHGELRLWKRYLFARKVRKIHYDQAIILPNSFKSALTAFWAKIPVRSGWLGEWRFGLLNDWRRLDKHQYPLMIQRFMALALSKDEKLPDDLNCYYPKLLVDETKRNLLIESLHLDTEKPILGICPGAEFGPAKRWPAEYFAVVAKYMMARGYQVWIFGSNKDVTIANKIMELTNQECINLCGRTSLQEAIDLLSLTSIVITNDSGLMHIAAALNCYLIILYGSSSPYFTPPLTNKVVVMNMKLDCSPCFKRICPLQHFNCMKQLLPDQVITKLEIFLETSTLSSEGGM